MGSVVAIIMCSQALKTFMYKFIFVSILNCKPLNAITKCYGNKRKKKPPICLVIEQVPIRLEKKTKYFIEWSRKATGKTFPSIPR